MRHKKSMKMLMILIVVAIVVAFIMKWVSPGSGDGSTTLRSIEATEGGMVLSFDQTKDLPKYRVVELRDHNRVGFIRDQKEDLSVLGESILKIWLTDVTFGENLLSSLGEPQAITIGEESIDVYMTENGTGVALSPTADENSNVIYLGLTTIYDNVHMAYDSTADTLTILYNETPPGGEEVPPTE